MVITATELKTNIGKYLSLAMTEDVVVTKNGKGIVKLTNIQQDKLAVLDSLVGLIADNRMTPEEAKAGRLIRQ
ncbi:MAG: type II toxin-antitoxin system prevent-host-death family antitoxin [Oscillospiraceae bacterium]|nr:type II toxin-antitoxin system prevent-host-death family antitoxin [Oscillospiraceae bacterium]